MKLIHLWDVFSGDPGFSQEHVGQVRASTKAEAISKGRQEWGAAPHGPGGRIIRQAISVKKLYTISNPRRVRSNSTTLRNLASVKITRNRDGTVGIVARRNAPKKNRGGLKKAQRRFVHEGFSPRVKTKFRRSVVRRAARRGKR